tara:strand:- start:12032 stop:12763 length:732 start_codon:yes stop_codon:yes gene_type:complete
MTKPLTAFLLAAGIGTRLRPITLNTPKCLVEINGKPLLGHWLDKLENMKCEKTLINTHHLAKQVEEFVDNYDETNMQLKIVHEPELLGTAGSLIHNRNWFKNSTGILIHADNATNENLDKFILHHKTRPNFCLLTMLTFNTNRPSQCGIVETDRKGVVTGFYEKVNDPPSNRANGAIYLFENSFLDWLEDRGGNIFDFSKDVLPLLIGRIYTWHTNASFIDIGTPDGLKEAKVKISKNNTIKK